MKMVVMAHDGRWDKTVHDAHNLVITTLGAIRTLHHDPFIMMEKHPL